MLNKWFKENRFSKKEGKLAIAYIIISILLFICIDNYVYFKVKNEWFDELQNGISLYEDEKIDSAIQVFSKLIVPYGYDELTFIPGIWNAKCFLKKGETEEAKRILNFYVRGKNDFFKDIFSSKVRSYTKHKDFDYIIESYDLLDSIFRKEENKENIILNYHNRLKTSIQQNDKQEIRRSFLKLKDELLEQRLYQELMIVGFASYMFLDNNFIDFNFNSLISEGETKIIFNEIKYLPEVYSGFNGSELLYMTSQDDSIQLEIDYGFEDIQYLLDFSLESEDTTFYKNIDIILKKSDFNKLAGLYYGSNYFSKTGEPEKSFAALNVMAEMIDSLGVSEKTVERIKVFAIQKKIESHFIRGEVTEAKKGLEYLLENIPDTILGNNKKLFFASQLLHIFINENDYEKAESLYSHYKIIVTDEISPKVKSNFFFECKRLFENKKDYLKAYTYSQKSDKFLNEFEQNTFKSIGRSFTYVSFINNGFSLGFSAIKILSIIGFFLIIAVALTIYFYNKQRRVINKFKIVLSESEKILTLYDFKSIKIGDITHITIDDRDSSYKILNTINGVPERDKRNFNIYLTDFPNTFIQIRKDCLVNLSHIGAISQKNNQVRLINTNVELKINRSYKENGISERIHLFLKDRDNYNS